jgi:hypothetical protein
VTNFFIKICPGKTREYEDHAKNKSKNTGINTHIVGRAHGLMDLKGSTGVCRLFQMLGTMSSDDFLNRSLWSLWRLHDRLNLLHRRFIGSHSLSRRSSGSIPLWVLVVAAKKTKGKRFHISRKEESKYKIIVELAKYSRVQGVEKFLLVL